MAANKHDDPQVDPPVDQHEQPIESTERPRASLRGRGREILLGQQADLIDDELVNPDQITHEADQPETIQPDALPLTPEETAALLDFPDSSPDIPLPKPDVLVPAEDLADDVPEWWQDAADDDRLDDAVIAALLDDDFDAAEGTVDVTLVEDGQGEPVVLPSRRTRKDSIPLPERAAEILAEKAAQNYQPHPDVDELIPREPEIWWVEPHFDSAEHEGGVIVPEGAVVVDDPPPVGLSEPFDPVYKRQPAKELFDETEPADPSLLHLLVDDDAIRKLDQQIDTLQAELAENVRSDRDSTDVYMNELLRASGLLMASRENYDDARAIVFRVRADMKREEKVDQAINDFRFSLLIYYACWAIAVGVLFLLRELFVGITDAVGVEAFAAMYNPMLFGITGALISGYLTLERHTTKLRDFDPVHVGWYLMNPLLGAVMGLIMFLIASIANEDLLDNAGSTAERAITYLLCVVAGMNQNNVLRQLNNVLERVSPGNGD
ncbi:MAG: hypothetical protein JXA10_19235 [Anaerolineae bacterium]|nr:hypothetical protein [Anaerolineae bacterium]